MSSKTLIYEEWAGCITSDSGGLVYESVAIETLSVKARRRLAEIHNENPGIDYEGAELILIAEGYINE